jgi:hypothetical protein
MKAGDLVKVPKCGDIIDCGCFFCHHKSSCIGIITGWRTFSRWTVMFDAGEWELGDWEIEVIK